MRTRILHAFNCYNEEGCILASEKNFLATPLVTFMHFALVISRFTYILCCCAFARVRFSILPGKHNLNGVIEDSRAVWVARDSHCRLVTQPSNGPFSCTTQSSPEHTFFHPAPVELRRNSRESPIEFQMHSSSVSVSLSASQPPLLRNESSSECLHDDEAQRSASGIKLNSIKILFLDFHSKFYARWIHNRIENRQNLFTAYFSIDICRARCCQSSDVVSSF